jgi:hypothetical protein
MFVLLDSTYDSKSAPNFDTSKFRMNLSSFQSSSAEDLEINEEKVVSFHPFHDANSAGLVVAAIERSLT